MVRSCHPGVVSSPNPQRSVRWLTRGSACRCGKESASASSRSTPEFSMRLGSAQLPKDGICAGAPPSGGTKWTPQNFWQMQETQWKPTTAFEGRRKTALQYRQSHRHFMSVACGGPTRLRPIHRSRVLSRSLSRSFARAGDRRGDPPLSLSLSQSLSRSLSPFLSLSIDRMSESLKSYPASKHKFQASSSRHELGAW